MRPTPGTEKSSSTTTAPPRSRPTWIPRRVTTTLKPCVSTGRRRELERGRQALRDLREHRAPGADRIPRVAVKERGEPGPVLDERRLIETEVRAKTRELLGGERRRGAESCRDGVAGDKADEQ